MRLWKCSDGVNNIQCVMMAEEREHVGLSLSVVKCLD